MTQADQALLDGLLPVGKPAVMDLVAQAGIDVSAWHVKKNGARVKQPKANPHYCYEWAYGSAQEGLLFCVWHDALATQEISGASAVVYHENMRSLVDKLESVARDKARPSADRNRARDQARRGRVFDQLLRLAGSDNLPVQMVINSGIRRTDADLGKNASKVKSRMLDSEKWFVHRYSEETGEFLVVRGISSPACAGGTGSTRTPRYVDQFSAPSPVARREVTAFVRDRSSAVRDNVLTRSKGLCELCGKRGFLTDSGSVYLETHHVVPLSEDGPDVESNVVALCPEDHRRAHFAAEKVEITATLKAFLLSCRDSQSRREQ